MYIRASDFRLEFESCSDLKRVYTQFSYTPVLAHQSELVGVGVAKEVSHDDATEVLGQVEVELLVHGDGDLQAWGDVCYQQHLKKNYLCSPPDAVNFFQEATCSSSRIF